MLIREMKQVACHFNGNGLIAIEREKPNSRISSCVIYISTEVEFMKPREPRQGREADGTYALHQKGYDAQPCLAIKSIDMESFRKA
jgi:hypothetical protein